METDTQEFACTFDSMKEREEFSIVWRVTQVQTLELEGIDGTYINSPFVQSKMCDGCMYYWRLYPKGNTGPDHIIKLCQFLRCYHPVKLDVRCEVRLETTQGTTLKTGLAITGHVDGHEGPFCSFSWADLQSSNGSWRMPDDILVIKMNVEAFRERPLHRLDGCLGQDLGKLREGGSWTDLEIVASGQVFRAHKAILVARSPVFAAMFSSPLAEGKNGRVEINDIGPEAVDHMLRYAYTGEVEETNLEELLVIADKYCMQELKDLCCARLWLAVTDQTALRTLALAERHACPQLEEMMLRFVSSHPRTRLQTSPDLENMSKDQMIKLVKRIKLPK